MSNTNSLSHAMRQEPWTRLWVPVPTWDQHRGIDDDFLSSYGGRDGIDHALDGPLPGIGSLSDFDCVPFLMLLGRPGSGKSQELRDAEEHGWLGQPTVRVEAKEIGTTHPSIYLSSILPPSCVTPTRLMIDGLDELLLQNPNFVPQLKAWFRQRLDSLGRPLHHLAISCRWADWQQAQVEQLANLWPQNDAKTLILCPLLHSDVVDTLRRRFGDKAEVFWRQMSDLHLRHVACWPQGLLGLMNQFQDSRCERLAASHADVIHDQVVRLCRLSDSPDDTLRWQESIEGAEWRRRVAGRVAAAMIWSGKAQLDLTLTAAESSRAALKPNEFSSTEELWEGRRVVVSLSHLDELVHRTSLMKRLTGREHWVFQSQVHQEWLAADWLAAQQLGFKRLQQLFGTFVDGRWTIFPALKATAAWLARFDSEFRRHVLDNDPLTLLRMDGASLPEHEREEVVDALLQATHAIRVVDPGIRQAHLPSLKHSRLLDQLTHWLTDGRVCDEAKELAIEIAEKTELRELAGLLWNLFPQEVGRLQIEIAGALSRLAQEGHDERWQSVLRSEIPVDERGRIVGAALDILVIKTKRLPVRDVLAWILPERHFKDGVWDQYQFNIRLMHEHMTVDDLPAVFAKLSEYPPSIHDSFSRAEDFNKAAVRMAIRDFDRPHIRQSLVDYWHACLQHHAPPHHHYNQVWEPASLGLEDDAKRRKIILALINHPAFISNTDRKWLSTGDFLLMEHDFEWCLDQILDASPDEEWRFSLAIASFIWRVDLSGTLGEKLVDTWNKSPALREMLPATNPGESVVDAVRRVAAEQQAKRERQGQSWEKKQAKRDQKFREYMERYTADCREAHERGDVVWPGAENILGARTSGPGSRIVSFTPISQIGPEDNWMVEAAKRYLTDCPLKEGLEYDQGLYGLLALAACPTVLDHDGPVRQSIENRWLPLLIEQLSGHGLGDPPEGISLERLAQLFPEAFTSAFGVFCRQRYGNKDSLLMLHSFEDCWLAGMTVQLQKVLLEETPQYEGFFNGMRYLVARSQDAAITVALKWIQDLGSETPEPTKAAVVGAAAFLVSGRLAAEVEQHLSNHVLLSAAMRAAAHRLDWADSRIDFTDWPDHALKSLADACWQAMPRLEGSSYGAHGFRQVSDEDQAMQLRDQISAAVRGRGLDVLIPDAHQSDSEAEARQRVQTIHWHRHSVMLARASNAWAHVPAETFFWFTSRPNARLARNQDELLVAVMECLQAWEVRLKAGSWDHLWDIRSRTARPEKRIAREMRDWLHEHLDIMVEREIELASEDRTDVVVQTHPADPSAPKLTVVIELKKHRAGNARERRTAMRTQLMDRYLREREHEGWTHGLYVIAWTPAPGTKDDSSEVIASTRLDLEQQAAILSIHPFKIQSMVIDARFQARS